MTSLAEARSRGRDGCFWFERSGDLPFYDGQPVTLSAIRWLFVLLGVAAGFTALVAPIPAVQVGLAGFLPAVLFFAIPLTVLAAVAPHGWTQLFRAIPTRDFLWMIAFAGLNIAVTLTVGYFVQRVLDPSANPMFQRLPEMSRVGRVLFFARMVPQLLGEEILTILPFLAVATFLYGPVGAPRRWALFGAWIASALLFGAVHLPTYDWNLAQCFLIIGSARLVLTLPYIMTRNIWVSAGAHIVNDWTLFGGVLALNSLKTIAP